MRENYIKTEIFSTEMSDIIYKLFNVRSSSDCDDFYIISKDKVSEKYENAKIFVETVEKYLK